MLHSDFDLSNSRYKYQEDPVSFFVLKNLWTKNMIISSRNQLLLRNISKLTSLINFTKLFPHSLKFHFHA
ncbi:hypothetical protein P618_200077 [Holospora obtusa F1]|uniref:Uncharacterized protein n=1 Tax=Holospora obtusa F1 TaxID=1399147 RepID=W6TFF9_HOLOB|nr:hypothetical protein P618_200077 [Holospora obtusa F1]